MSICGCIYRWKKTKLKARHSLQEAATGNVLVYCDSTSAHGQRRKQRLKVLGTKHGFREELSKNWMK